MMCVSAGKSEGEIAWRRCEGIGSRRHVVGCLERRSLDTSASVRGQKVKRGVFVTVRMEGSKRKRIVNTVFNEGAKNKASLSCVDVELRKIQNKT